MKKEIDELEKLTDITEPIKRAKLIIQDMEKGK